VEGQRVENRVATGYYLVRLLYESTHAITRSGSSLYILDFFFCTCVLCCC
jgi:hypothetical protein